MKKELFVFLFILTSITAFAAQMYVVGEVFTYTWCQYCPQARIGIADLYETQDYVVPLIWEGDGPHPSPMYSERASLYPVSGLPHAQFQGMSSVSGGGTNMLPFYTNEYNLYVNIDSPFEVNLELNIVGGDLELTADVEVTGTVAPGDDNKIILLLTHDYGPEYTCSVQKYEELDFDLVNIGSTDSFTSSFDIDPGWQLGGVRGVAIIQKMNGTTGNYPVRQAAIIEYPLSTPNPLANQEMQMNGTITLDLTDFFYYQGNPVAADLSVQSSEPDIVETVLDGTDLILNSFDSGGSSVIEITGEYNGYTAMSAFIVFVLDPSVHSVLIWDFDPSPTGEILKTSIENFYSDDNVILTDNIYSFAPNANTDAVFVLLGVGSEDFVLSDTEAQLLANYLDDGGNLYMEGGNTWYWDGPTVVHPYFKILGLNIGGTTLLNVEGQNFLEDMYWDYTGALGYIDQIYAIAPAENLFYNPTFDYYVGVAYDEGSYKTIGTSFEITGLTGENTLYDAVGGIMDFFGIATDAQNNVIPSDQSFLAQNYPNPFNPETTIEYNVTETSSFVNIEVFNVKGQKIKTLINEQHSSGQHAVVWNGTDETGKSISSGIYYYRMKIENDEFTKKMILLK